MTEIFFAVFASMGWAIVHSLWIACVVAAAYAFLSKCFPHQLNLRYHAGGLALTLILVSAVGVFFSNLAQQWPSAITASNADDVLLMVATDNAEGMAAAGDDFTVWAMGLGLVWLFGAVLSAFRLWRSHRLLRDMAQQARFDDVLQSLAQVLSARLRLRLPVRVAISEWIEVPCVIGLIKPIILVPTALVARLPTEQMELILLHELSHVKNGDLWVNALQILVEVMMFFHPAVYWISADLRALRERRCDRSVLQICPTPVRYAQTLLRLEEFRQEFRGLAIAAGGGELSTRVRDILMPRLNTPGVARANHGAALLSAVTLTALVAGSITQLLAPHALETAKVEDVPRAIPTSLPDAPVRPIQTLSVPVAPLKTLALPSSIPAAALFQRDASLDGEASQVQALDQARRALRSTAGRDIKPQLLASLGNVDLRALVEPELPSPPVLEQVAPPKLVFQVNPEFHAGAQREYHFSMSFGVDSNGLPRDIRFVKGNATKSQIAAASAALAQWRFDPKASAQFGEQRLQQAFNFKEIERPCVQVVGTRICRRLAR